MGRIPVGEIDYRLEIWATRPDGCRVEAWSHEFSGDGAWPHAVNQELVRLGGKGWSRFAVFANGRSLLLATPPENEERGPELTQDEHDEIDALTDEATDLDEGEGPALAAVRHDDGDEQRMLFR